MHYSTLSNLVLLVKMNWYFLFTWASCFFPEWKAFAIWYSPEWAWGEDKKAWGGQAQHRHYLRSGPRCAGVPYSLSLLVLMLSVWIQCPSQREQGRSLLRMIRLRLSRKMYKVQHRKRDRSVTGAAMGPDWKTVLCSSRRVDKCYRVAGFCLGERKHYPDY